ncbi:hypothetical protein HK102_003306 [Quaeritorhiza haematococci]|nr:hypothetical protein HK102_003306 [Quaeritorhiza haematococci]
MDGLRAAEQSAVQAAEVLRGKLVQDREEWEVERKDLVRRLREASEESEFLTRQVDGYVRKLALEQRERKKESRKTEMCLEEMQGRGYGIEVDLTSDTEWDVQFSPIRVVVCDWKELEGDPLHWDVASRSEDGSPGDLTDDGGAIDPEEQPADLVRNTIHRGTHTSVRFNPLWRPPHPHDDSPSPAPPPSNNREVSLHGDDLPLDDGDLTEEEEEEAIVENDENVPPADIENDPFRTPDRPRRLSQISSPPGISRARRQVDFDDAFYQGEEQFDQEYLEVSPTAREGRSTWPEPRPGLSQQQRQERAWRVWEFFGVYP